MHVYSEPDSSFLEIALPLVKRGIKVIPVQPLSKCGVLEDQFRYATTDPRQIECWNTENPHFNVGCVGTPDGICILDSDYEGLIAQIERETRQHVPKTFTVKSAGKGLPHLYFLQTPQSVAAGNQKSAHFFDLQSNNKYVVGAGSRLENGRTYDVTDDSPMVPIPDFLIEWIVKNADIHKVRRESANARAVVEDFDPFDVYDHYGIEILGTKDDVWQVVSECPGVGHRHEQSTLTAFYWDGATWGWSCFASNCPLSGLSIGEVLKALNKEHAPYRGKIWEEDGLSETLAQFGIELEDDSPNTSSEDQPDSMYEAICKTVGEQNEPLPVPNDVMINDPDQRTGLEFPPSAMYGKLREMALKYPRLQLGWLYPSMLAVASALNIETSSTVRSNLYVANLGEVGYGKSACSDAAVSSIVLPELTVMEETPSSDRGLAKMLNGDAVRPVLIHSDEFRAVMQKGGIQGSALPQMLCQLWGKNKAGVSDKKGLDPCFAKLSILGNVPITDSAEFGRIFGTSTASGMADRFLYGYSTQSVKYRPNPNVRPESLEIREVRMPDWVWDAKDRWTDLSPDTRRRLGEHALRIALVSAGANGDREVTKEGFEAALRFMEWQERIRTIYRPGVAETKEAEAFDAIWLALKAQRDHQMSTKTAPKGAETVTSNKDHQLELVHWRRVINGKSYYRKYAGLVDRVKQTMADSEIIEMVKEMDHDEGGKDKPGKKTMFVRLMAHVR